MAGHPYAHAHPRAGHRRLRGGDPGGPWHAQPTQSRGFDLLRRRKLGLHRAGFVQRDETRTDAGSLLPPAHLRPCRPRAVARGRRTPLATHESPSGPACGGGLHRKLRCPAVERSAQCHRARRQQRERLRPAGRTFAPMVASSVGPRIHVAPGICGFPICGGGRRAVGHGDVERTRPGRTRPVRINLQRRCDSSRSPEAAESLRHVSGFGSTPPNYPRPGSMPPSASPRPVPPPRRAPAQLA